jgi:NAD(P)-dependent dehydrogenase (short-subunit alcohol dehydrogenase family)
MSPHGVRQVKDRRCALVTGGAVRLGRAITVALARAGFDVAIGYHRSAEAARRTVRALRATGARAVALRADLAHPRAAEGLVRRAARALGGLDVLVNSAAVFTRTPLPRVTPSQYDRHLDLNLRAAFFCAQAASVVMGARGGHIVNVGDADADRAWPDHIPYGLSKTGIVALTRALAVALRPRRIAVNCVAPGPVLRPPRFPRARWRALTGGRGDRVDGVAAATVRFATCPPRVTGRILDVDGRRGR